MRLFKRKIKIIRQKGKKVILRRFQECPVEFNNFISKINIILTAIQRNPILIDQANNDKNQIKARMDTSFKIPIVSIHSLKINLNQSPNRINMKQ